MSAPKFLTKISLLKRHHNPPFLSIFQLTRKMSLWISSFRPALLYKHGGKNHGWTEKDSYQYIYSPIIFLYPISECFNWWMIHYIQLMAHCIQTPFLQDFYCLLTNSSLSRCENNRQSMCGKLVGNFKANSSISTRDHSNTISSPPSTKCKIWTALDFIYRLIRINEEIFIM